MKHWHLSSWGLGLLSLTMVVLVGCGGEKFATVSGKVIFKGEPLPGGTVVFSNADSSKVDRVEIDTNGNYTAKRVPYGTIKVHVEPVPKVVLPPDVAKLKLPEGEGTAKAYGQKKTYVDIPQKYRDPSTSNLTLVVDSGDKKFDIDLK